MTNHLLQKYHEVAKAIIPYTHKADARNQMALITIDPALPCFICSQPATAALTTPAPDRIPGVSGTPWLTFPICAACEERQVKSQVAGSE